MLIGDSASGKTNSLFNVISHQPDIVKTDWEAKDPYEAKHKFLINKLERTGLKHLNDSEAFIEYSSDMDDTYKNFKEYNPNKKQKNINCFLWYDCWYAW